MRRLVRLRIEALARPPDIAFAHRFQVPPHGGGSNHFLLNLRGELERRGLRIGEAVSARRTRAVLLNAHVFDEVSLRRMLRPDVRVVHRVDGPIRLYRGFDDGSDERISRLNAEFADATVIQSRYSLEASREQGIDFTNPVIIPNAPDPRVFYPARERRLPGTPIRLIATMWSSNPRKGAATLRELERHLDQRRFELTVVGPSAVTFERAKLLSPRPPHEVAELLRTHDVYLAPSLHEPCSNALLEGLACDLPALFANSGSHAEIVGDGGLPFDTAEEAAAQLERLTDEYETRRDAISIPRLDDVADQYLEVLGMRA